MSAEEQLKQVCSILSSSIKAEKKVRKIHQATAQQHSQQVDAAGFGGATFGGGNFGG